MAIPIAVSPSVVTPGLFLTIDLLAGAANPGTATLRTIIMAPAAAAGDLTDDTEVREGAGEASAATAFGQGSIGHLMAKLIYNEFPTALVDFIAVTAGAGLATLGLTFSGAPTSNATFDFDIHGRTFEVVWLVGESTDDIKTKTINAIVERTDDLMVTAVTGGVGVVTVNAKVTGNLGNDILILAALRGAASGTEALAGAATPTNMASGSADPDNTTALSTIEGKEYHFIVPGFSNTEANLTTGNMLRLNTHIDNLNVGKDSKLQQAVIGQTKLQSEAVTSAVARNEEVYELIHFTNARSLPGEVGAREAGGRLAAISIDPAANRIGETMDGLFGSHDIIADKQTLAESETALNGGVSLISYNAQDQPVLVRAITTHSQDAAGGSDKRLLDTQNVDATYIVARDLRTALPAEFPQAKITPDVEPGDDPPPVGVIEERDILAFVISQLRFWQRQGVITQASIDASIADDTLIVKVNASDATQVDIVIPFKIVPPLAKFGVVVQRQPN